MHKDSRSRNRATAQESQNMMDGFDKTNLLDVAGNPVVAFDSHFNRIPIPSNIVEKDRMKREGILK